MRPANCKIGFDDRLVMLFVIPVLSFIIPVVFFGCRFNRQPYFSWNDYITCLIITSVLWIGDRYIMVWCRRRYPLFADVQKRLVEQSVIMFVYTVIGNNVIGFVMDAVVFKQTHAGKLRVDILIGSNAAAFFCTITAIAIYESIYFMNELRKSVEEKELLKRESLNAQLDALRTQVNPHFLFNNLNTLCSLIPDNPRHAVDFVQQLSKVYRHILEVKDEQSILLKNELDVMKAYGFLLQTRFGENLGISINVPDEKLKKRIVPLSLQILMENAIKHNIVSSDKPLHIDVFASNGRLVVSNNLQKKNQLIESTGIGLDNIRNRYKLLSDKQVEVTENGLNFTVSIPPLSKTNMRVIIIEDEIPAANRLAKMLQNISDEMELVKKLDSVEAATRFLRSADDIDLIFMDIQLADGLSFDIFQQTEVKAPVIFTTAFDQYTLKAFKVNSIDYLLKPIDEKELERAVEKYRLLYNTKENGLSGKILKMVQDMNTMRYKERLLIKRGQQLSYLKTASTAYFYADGKLCYAVDFTGNKYLLECNLSLLAEQLEPGKFYRINRQLVVNVEAIHKVHTWLGGRLKLELIPSAKLDTIVSRERVNGFKAWLGQ